MERRTKLLIFLSLLFVAVISVLYFVFSKKPSQPVPSQPIVEPQPSPSFPIPSASDPKMTITTPQGTLELNNVYKNPLENLSNGGVSFKDNSDYYMAYYPQDQGFLVVIQNPDIKTARDKAEADLLETLGIDKSAACKLKVSITVPYDVNASASGQEYGLSFCPNAKQFPNQ